MHEDPMTIAMILSACAVFLNLSSRYRSITLLFNGREEEEEEL